MWITGLLPTPLHSTHMYEHILFLKCIPFINCPTWFIAEFWLSPPKYSPHPLLSLPLRPGVRTPVFILLNVTVQRALLLKGMGDLLLFNISQSLPPLSRTHNVIWQWIPPQHWGLTAVCCPSRRQLEDPEEPACILTEQQWCCIVLLHQPRCSAAEPWGLVVRWKEALKVTSLAVLLPPGEVRRSKPLPLKESAS